MPHLNISQMCIVNVRQFCTTHTNNGLYNENKPRSNNFASFFFFFTFIRQILLYNKIVTSFSQDKSFILNNQYRKIIKNKKKWGFTIQYPFIFINMF